MCIRACAAISQCVYMDVLSESYTLAANDSQSARHSSIIHSSIVSYFSAHPHYMYIQIVHVHIYIRQYMYIPLACTYMHTMYMYMYTITCGAS